MALPDSPNLDWLRKQAKRRLTELRQGDRAATLSDAQFELAREHGFPSWRALKAHIESLSVDGHLIEAARTGDVDALAALLDHHPGKLQLRDTPYEWTLLHIAAAKGRLWTVDLLLRRGLDVNAREKGDNTYAMHWAAAAGHREVVHRLADAGGDVVGRGDDHALEVIGWATCWEQCHADIAALLLDRGARHHIFSAIAMNLADEVRRIVADDPSALGRRLTRNDEHRTPLMFAVLKHRREMVSLLIELGADPLAVDASGHPVAAYATAPDLDRPVMERIRAMTKAEWDSAERGHRSSRGGMIDLLAALALGEWEMASSLVQDHPGLIAAGGAGASALHLMSKRNDAAAVRWLLDRGADPNRLWAHWDADVTPLHLAILAGHTDLAQVLLDAGANPRLRDSKHQSDAFGWAEFFGRADMLEVLRARAPEA